jgi:AraC-like DNA-binding protein
MHAHPGRAWTVSELVESSNLSRSAFTDQFQRVVGQAPLSFVTTWRLDRAAELLRFSRARISEIASRVGYTSDAGAAVPPAVPERDNCSLPSAKVINER